MSTHRLPISDGEMPLVVTPIILTLDEAPNIERVLARLHWAAAVMVVDSGSTDAGGQSVGGRADGRAGLFAEGVRDR